MTAPSFTVGSMVNGFRVERVQEIPELRCTARILSHVKTGARLIHLLNDDPNNLFCCGFRTPVSDSTGVPHILEHSVLGGSKAFPFKDPFQQLLKSSLQTFLNAMTYPDKTVYPVGSQVEKDFYNLVNVYCDAVFHPLLTENTFYQEGWHFDVEDPKAPVGIKGIVYNEMKGVFSEFSSHVGRRTMSALFPDTTYANESGGDPERIPDLTYAAFRAFHARYYHPSNAFVYLYGNLPTEKTLAFVDERYLSSYDRITVDSAVKAQPLWPAPRRLEFEAPAPLEDQGFATANVCWLFGSSTDPVRSMGGAILAHYLLGAESSPLRRALVDSGLGQDLDDMCGFESDLAQSMFTAGLRKTTAERADRIRDLIFEALRQQVDKGLDKQLLEGCLRQTEFSLREITDGGRYPYSLRLADRVYRSWLYDGDPLAHLTFERTLDAIRTSRGTPAAFFAGLIRDALLSNPHHLLSVVKASPQMGKELSALTERQAARLSKGFGADDVARCQRLTEALVTEQKRQPTASELARLPRLTRSDLPLRNREVPALQGALEGAALYQHPLFCGGIVYVDIGFDCARLPADLVPYLPLYCELAARCGAADLSYQEMATRISLATGGVSVSVMLEEPLNAARSPLFRVFFHAKCLAARFGETTAILSDLFQRPTLDDGKLISDIVLEMRNEYESSLISQGHTIAAMHAASKLSALRAVCEQLDGIAQLRFLDRLSKHKDWHGVAASLSRLHASLMDRTAAVVSMTADDPALFRQDLTSLLGVLPKKTAPAALPFALPSGPRATGIEISSSVNFVSRAWRLGSQSAEDLGTLNLISANLSRGFLWDKVRVEGGAYGAFASIGSTYPVYTCASYRDPNLKRTLAAFEAGLRYAEQDIDAAGVDESIIATIGQMDKPKGPHGYGFAETCALLLGRTPELRQQSRDAVLGATSAAVRKKAREILDAADTALTVLGSAESLAVAQKEGVMMEREPLLGPQPPTR
jgi:Zn-dependent M16 (insulinase) family peptidase